MSAPSPLHCGPSSSSPRPSSSSLMVVTGIRTGAGAAVEVFRDTRRGEGGGKKRGKSQNRGKHYYCLFQPASKHTGLLATLSICRRQGIQCDPSGQLLCFVDWKFCYVAYYAGRIVCNLAKLAVKCPIQISTSLLRICARKEPFESGTGLPAYSEIGYNDTPAIATFLGSP